MLQLQPPQSYTTTNPFSVPTHSFIINTPKKSIFLRRVGPTFSLTCHHPELFHPKPFPPPQRPQSSSSSSFSSSVGELPARVHVSRSVYKGKAVLVVSPVLPKFTSSDSGTFKISKEGLMLLQFVPSAGFRQYDWNRKQVSYCSFIIWCWQHIRYLYSLEFRFYRCCQALHITSKRSFFWFII